MNSSLSVEGPGKSNGTSENISGFGTYGVVIGALGIGKACIHILWSSSFLLAGPLGRSSAHLEEWPWVWLE